MEAPHAKRLNDIAKRYKKEKQKEHHIDFCVMQKDLADAIEVGAKSIDDRNKIHSHQWRIGRIRLNIFAELLKSEEARIKKSRTFDELLLTIEAVECDGIGDLTKYDIATRIGEFLRLLPDKIYLHAGTKEGAKNLLGEKIKGKKYLMTDELPKELLNHGFTALDLENMFCHCKDEFKDLSIPGLPKRKRYC